MSSTPGPAPSDSVRGGDGTLPAGTRALVGRRLAAVTIDWVLSLLVAGLIFRESFLGPPIVFFAEYTFFTGLFGQTPGMRLLGLACVRVEDGRPLGLARAALRAFLLNLVIPAVVYDKDGRGLHDRAAGSVVVRAQV